MMKNRFSVVIDSAFRMREEYPKSTRFVIPVNDSAITKYIKSPISIFSWQQTSRVMMGTVAGGNQSTIILSNNLLNNQENYYVGCQLVLLSSGNPIESSMIISYNTIDNSVTVKIPFQNNVQINDDIRIEYPDTKMNPYIIQITGYNATDLFEYGALYLYNFTKKWIRQIVLISSVGLINLKEAVPLSQYDYNDVFEIRTSLQVLQFSLSPTDYGNGVYKYVIENSTHPYQVGSRVYIEPDEITGRRQVFLITDIDENNNLTLKTIEYGWSFLNSQYYPLYDMDNMGVDVGTLAKIVVIQTRPMIDVGTNAVPNPQQNVIYLGNDIMSELLYYSYEIQENYIILIDDMFPYDLIINFNVSEYGFLERTVLQCAMNVPNFSIPDNQICMTVKLDCLILPNRNVKNYGRLLSFFPYVIVRLYNIEAPQYSRYGNVISNNATSTNAQFICPIGNLLNPTIIKFVEVKSDMVQQLKLSPYQDLLFEVLLPNGDLLEFEDVNGVNILHFTIRDTVACLLSFSVN